MLHFNFWILSFSTNFCPIKSDLSGNTVWPQLKNVNVARFARNVEWDFFCDFQTQWIAIPLPKLQQYCLILPRIHKKHLLIEFLSGVCSDIVKIAVKTDSGNQHPHIKKVTAKRRGVEGSWTLHLRTLHLWMLHFRKLELWKFQLLDITPSGSFTFGILHLRKLHLQMFHLRDITTSQNYTFHNFWRRPKVKNPKV